MNWLTCSIDKLTLHISEDVILVNPPVNLEQCSALLTNKDSWRDIRYFTITFVGASVLWAYGTIEERDADYQRLLNVIKEDTQTITAEPVEPGETLGVWDNGFINVPRYSPQHNGGMQIVYQGEYVEAKTMYLITGELMIMLHHFMPYEGELSTEKEREEYIRAELLEKGLIS